MIEMKKPFYQIKEIFTDVNRLYSKRINLIAQATQYDIKLHYKPKDNEEKDILIFQMHLVDETGSIALIAKHDIDLITLNTLFIFRDIEVTLIHNKLYLIYDDISQLIKPSETPKASTHTKPNDIIDDYSDIKLTQFNFSSII